MPKKLNLDENEVIELYNTHNSTYKVSELLNCSRTPIEKILKKYNIDRNGSTIGLDENQVLELYNIHNSTYKVSELLNCSVKPISRILKKHNIERNGNKIGLDENQVLELYNIHNSTVKVSKLLHSSNQTIANILKKHNIDRNGNKINLDENQVLELYNTHNSTYKVAELLNCNYNTIAKILKKYNVILNNTGKSDHGMVYTRTYNIWALIKQRCLNPNHTHYKDYGGRGITISEDWLDFNNFLKDMGECPEEHSIERLDVEKGYNKDNCIWLDNKLQQRNKRTTLRVDGVPLVELYEKSNCQYCYEYITQMYHRDYDKMLKLLGIDS